MLFYQANNNNDWVSAVLFSFVDGYTGRMCNCRETGSIEYDLENGYYNSFRLELTKED